MIKPIIDIKKMLKAIKNDVETKKNEKMDKNVSSLNNAIVTFSISVVNI